MCILIGEPCPIIFKGVTAPGLDIFFKEYFVFTTLPKPFVQCADVYIAKGMVFPTV
jgi:hypothetical protein